MFPNLFVTRDWFSGGQCFHEPVEVGMDGLGMIQVHIIFIVYFISITISML